jgi:hypothetical protein
MRVPVAVVAEAKDKEEEDGQEKQANLCTDEPTLQPANLCVPAMGSCVRRGYVLGCRDL